MNLLLAAALLSQIQVRDSPKDWKRLTTEHFDLYYPAEELLPRARDFAGWFEEAHGDLSRRTGVTPKRVHVFLYRSFHDLLQTSFFGRSEPVWDQVRRPSRDRGASLRDACRPHIRSRALAFAEPLRDRIFIHCQGSDRWNAWFVRHELAHHFQFEQMYPMRIPGWVIALKNPLTPSWWIEGGADYLAGIFDSTKDQYMRDLASERLYSLKELFSRDILNDHDTLAPYYEGSYFWRFVEEKHGAAKRLFSEYHRDWAPFMSAGLARTGLPPRNILEEEFAEHLQAKWEPMMAGRGRPDQRLTDVRNYYRRRAWGGRWSPDGKRLAWISDEATWPELYVDGEGVLGWRRGIDVGWVVSAPSWSPDGKRIVVVEWTTNRDALLIVNLEGGLESIDLPFDEIFDPAWSPDGAKIAFSALRNGVSDIHTLTLADRSVEAVTKDAHGDSSPAWSPEGKLAWIKEIEGRTVLHVDGAPVTKSWALLEHPQWSPDGRRIILSADVGGVYDAFEVDPAGGRARRLTKLRGGVSYPSVHPDGSLLFTYYEGRGQDLYRAPFEPQEAPDFDQEDRKGWYDQFKKPAPQGEPAEKSREFGVNWVMFPVSSMSLVTPAVEFMAGDLDAENHFMLVAAGAPGAWGAAATVSNSRWRPSFGVTAATMEAGSIEERRVQPFIQIPLYPTLAFGAGWVARYIEEAEEDRPDPDFNDSGPTVSLLYTNRMSYLPHDPAWGFSFGGNATFYREDLEGDRDLTEYFGFFEASYDIAQDWIVWARLQYEKRIGDDLLESEVYELRGGVRGAEDLEGPERGVFSLELRFPLWRDVMWAPFGFLGLEEFLVIKDLRAFAFGQVGFAGQDDADAFEDGHGAGSAGLGVRIDFVAMPWPLLTVRAPLRLELWWAIVGQDDDPARGAVGAGISAGF